MNTDILNSILTKLKQFTQDSPQFSTSGEMDVKTAVARLTDEENLIGDGSQECALPTIRGKQSDLKSITGDTVSQLK